MFNANMKDQHGKTVIPPYRKTASLTSLCTDISPSSSHFFEVLYIGKVRAPNRKIPEKFIDVALSKFRRNDFERYGKNFENSALYNGIRRPSQDIAIRLTEAETTGEVICGSSADQQTDQAANNGLSKYGSEENLVSKVASVSRDQSLIVNGPKRPRSGSLASTNGFTNVVEHNRTMVFQVGRTDLRLISPDRKQILLHKQLKELISTVQGLEHPDHFAIICRDSVTSESFVGYIFKCESESVASEVIGAISQSHFYIETRRRENRMVSSCDHCPMIWFHKLCAELDGMKDDLEMQVAIYRKLEELPDDEQETIMAKLHTAESLSEDEKDQHSQQNKFLLMLLKAHCEGKQSRHVHDTIENRHEFLNHYLGGSTIFMKAKRSLTNSFDQLLKRKSSKDDIASFNKELNSSQNSPGSKEITSKTTNTLKKDILKPKSLTFKSTGSPDKTEEIGDLEYSESVIGTPKSMMNIFLKVGNSPKTVNPPEEYSFENIENNRHAGSWRQTIFKNVNTPQKHIRGISPLLEERETLDYKSLWKKAINQQILLIRMERENAKLRARQEEATVKRIKLEYDDINQLGKESLEMWDSILKDRKKYDDHMLLQLIRQGVPRSKRGEIWMFLTEQYIAKVLPPVDVSKFPNYKVPYEQLLKQLTSQQHAILIDLGRTFPSHSYFMSPLGPGQLALYNLLKAYSLLDPEVGYCQGLSFIAGVLLLHMSEEHAFLMLRHLMFRRNLRKQYLPDMVAFQIQLYQLTRLMKDLLPDLYQHFDLYEISATLYAAPWMLTIFASQFPLGFAVRVFDLIFAGDSAVVFKVIVSVLKYHKDNLMACIGFETIMDYLKNAVPIVDKRILEAVIKDVYNMDVSKQLLEYSVEYNVLQEELACPRTESRQLKRAEETIKLLKEQNRGLSEQLEITLNNNNRLETTRVKYMAQINKLEAEIKALEVTATTLGNFVSRLSCDKNDDVDIPTDVLRILSQLHLAERRRSSLSNEISTAAVGAIISDVGVKIDTANTTRKSKLTLGQLRSSSSQHATNKSSSYFAKSFDQIAGGATNSRKLTKSMSLDINADFKDNNEVTVDDKKRSSSFDIKPIKFERIVEESDRVYQADSNNNNNVTSSESSKMVNLTRKNCDNIATTTVGGNATSVSGGTVNVTGGTICDDNNNYPLNCGGIQISYSGATKLRTIKPTRTKSECQINVPVSMSSRRNTLSSEFKSNGFDGYNFIGASDYVKNNDDDDEDDNNNNKNNADDDNVFIDKSVQAKYSNEIIAEQNNSPLLNFNNTNNNDNNNNNNNDQFDQS